MEENTPPPATASLPDLATVTASAHREPLVCQTATPTPVANLRTHPTVAEIAGHGELYDFISFTNVPQWVALNALLWNAYRTASQRGDKTGQLTALVHILMLPQRVLTRLSRGGAGGGRRIIRTVRARCYSVGGQLRTTYTKTSPAQDDAHIPIIV